MPTFFNVIDIQQQLSHLAEGARKEVQAKVKDLITLTEQLENASFQCITDALTCFNYTFVSKKDIKNSPAKVHPFFILHDILSYRIERLIEDVSAHMNKHVKNQFTLWHDFSHAKAVMVHTHQEMTQYGENLSHPEEKSFHFPFILLLDLCALFHDIVHGQGVLNNEWASATALVDALDPFLGKLRLTHQLILESLIDFFIVGGTTLITAHLLENDTPQPTQLTLVELLKLNAKAPTDCFTRLCAYADILHKADVYVSKCFHTKASFGNHSFTIPRQLNRLISASLETDSARAVSLENTAAPPLDFKALQISQSIQMCLELSARSLPTLTELAISLKKSCNQSQGLLKPQEKNNRGTSNFARAFSAQERIPSSITTNSRTSHALGTTNDSEPQESQKGRENFKSFAHTLLVNAMKELKLATETEESEAPYTALPYHECAHFLYKLCHRNNASSEHNYVKFARNSTKRVHSRLFLEEESSQPRTFIATQPISFKELAWEEVDNFYSRLDMLREAYDSRHQFTQLQKLTWELLQLIPFSAGLYYSKEDIKNLLIEAYSFTEGLCATSTSSNATRRSHATPEKRYAFIYAPASRQEKQTSSCCVIS